MLINGCQTFFLDRNAVGGSEIASIPRVDVYFAGKPLQTNNKSGINSPGVTMFLIPVKDGTPDISNLSTAPSSRVEYSEVLPSGNASVPTTFLFPSLPSFATNREWAYALKYDGNEDFMIWRSVPGGTVIAGAPGPGMNFVGSFFTYCSPPHAPYSPNTSPATTSNNGIVNSPVVSSVDNFSNQDDVDALTNIWRPHAGVAQTFKVYVARYRIQGNSEIASIVGGVPEEAIKNFGNTPFYSINNTSGVVTWKSPAVRKEYVIFDRERSKISDIKLGERCWQQRPYHRGANVTPYTVNCVSSNTDVVINSNAFSWADYLQLGNEEWLVFTSLNHDGAGLHKVAIRQVESIISNTTVRLIEPLNFTNNTSYVYKAPSAELVMIRNISPFGVSDDMAILIGSNANSSVRFVNNAIESANVAAGGSGYSNSDYVTVTGFESVSNKVLGGYQARANLVTNSSGGIVSLHFSNNGAGFVNSSAIVTTISNSTGGSSSGTLASFNYNVGMTILAEHSYNGNTGYFANCRLNSVEVGLIRPSSFINNPMGTYFSMEHRLPYYMVDDTSVLSGKVVYCDTLDADNDVYPVKAGETTSYVFKKKRVLPSWSTELVTPYTSGAISNGYGCQANLVTDIGSFPVSNSSVIVIRGTSENDYSTVKIDPGTIEFSKFSINNDYTNEHTNFGNALAKGITKKFTLKNTLSEDVRVFLTAYRPFGTDIKVYARIHNSIDPEPFDDKDWTLLKTTSGDGLYSSEVDEDDMIELAYGFPSYPNVQYTLGGSVETTLTSSNLVGSNTTFSSNLAVYDVVRIYQPLFPNNEMIAVVTAITDNTNITISSPVSNNSLVGSGLKIDKIEFPNQAFNNRLNSNVVRYYSSNLIEYDGYDTCQFKIVFLSQNDKIIPRVDAIQAPALSA